MCGIFGLISFQPDFYNKHSKTIHQLLKLSSSRGKEASGILILNERNQVKYIKSGLVAIDLIKTKEYKKLYSECQYEKIWTVIGHSRLATNGTQLLNENNQPVISDDENLMIIHNGIITNTKFLWSQINKKDEEPVLDTKVMAEYISYHSKSESLESAVSRFMVNMEGTASFALLQPSTKKVILMTNTGSLYYSINNKNIHFASEKIFLEDALKDKDKASIHKINPGTGYVYYNGDFDLLKQNEYTNIDITKQNPKIEILEILVENQDFKSKHLYSFQNSIEILKKHTIDIGRLRSQKRCSKCILPSTTPFITFDEKGVCNFCNDYEKITYKGRDELERKIEKYRSKDGSPDCIAAFSGGRDSSYGLHYLKKELGLNPMAYTYDWGMVTDLARRNQARILGKLGIEHLLLSADITQKRMHIRKNVSAWMKDPHLGMVPLFMQGDKQCEFYADQLMKKYNIKLMFFFRGNELERGEFKNGHCGIKDADPGGVIHHLPFKDKFKLLCFYAGRYLKNPAYINSSFWDTSLAYFSTYIQKHDYVYLWHYIPWKEDIINKTLIDEYNWEISSETPQKWRTDDGSSAFYNYIYCQVQGSTENDSFRSRQIREGFLNRNEALEIVLEENKPRYEALKWYFDNIGMNGSEVLSVVDKMKKLY